MYANNTQKFYNEMNMEMDPIEGTIFDAEYQIWIDKYKLQKAESECERLAIKEDMAIQEKRLKEAIINKKIRDIEQDFV